MAKKIDDIERVDLVLKKYKELLGEVSLSKNSRDGLEEWLLKKSIYIGSKYYDHNALYESVPELKKNTKFQRAYKEFVSNIACKHAHRHKSLAPKDQKNITILFTGCAGGGHQAPATALAQHFKKLGHKVQFIDVSELENRYSPRVEGYTRAQIYSEVFQKEGNAEKARKLRERIDELYKPEKRRSMTDLKKMITNFEADHIFTVAHHRPHLSYVSFQLGIPMTYVHTDHVFHRLLLPILKEQMDFETPLVKFTALSNDEDFLKNVYEELKIEKGELPHSIRRQIVRLDFPVRSSFAPVTKKQMHEIHNTLAIPRNAMVCKLAMGQSGLTKEIEDTLRQLIHEEKLLHHPLYVYVVCGKNVALKTHLEKLVQRHLTGKSKIHIDLRGFMDETEMAQIDKACNVWITKPGGSTSAELVQTQKQMLYVVTPHHPWEKNNAKYLEKLNLAERLSSSKPLVRQIQKRCDFHKRVDLEALPTSRWQHQATRLAASASSSRH